MDGLASFPFSETSGHKVCLLWLKEEIIEKWSSFCPHRNADCLLKKTQPLSKTTMLSINNSNILMMSVSVNVFSQSGFGAAYSTYSKIRWSFLSMKHSWINYCNLSLNLSGEKSVDKSNVLMLLHGEPYIVCTLSHYIMSESTADWHHTWSS
jgi:hypothetical protein